MGVYFVEGVDWLLGVAACHCRGGLGISQVGKGWMGRWMDGWMGGSMNERQEKGIWKRYIGNI